MRGRHKRMHQTLSGYQVQYQSWKYPILLIKSQSSSKHQITKPLVLWFSFIRKTQNQWVLQNSNTHPQIVNIAGFVIIEPNSGYPRTFTWWFRVLSLSLQPPQQAFPRPPPKARVVEPPAGRWSRRRQSMDAVTCCRDPPGTWDSRKRTMAALRPA